MTLTKAQQDLLDLLPLNQEVDIATSDHTLNPVRSTGWHPITKGNTSVIRSLIAKGYLTGEVSKGGATVTKIKSEENPILSFDSRGKTYIVDLGDLFLKSEGKILFTPKDKSKHPSRAGKASKIYYPVREWFRIEKLLTRELLVDMSGVTVWRYVNQIPESKNITRKGINA